MGVLKRLFFLVLALAVIAVAVVMSPFVQKSVAMWFLKKHFENVSLERISAGPKTIRISGFSLDVGNTALKIGDCKAKWSLRELIFSKRINIKDLTISGLGLSVVNERDDGEYSSINLDPTEIHRDITGKSIPVLYFARFASNPQLPVKMTIDHMHITGFVNLSDVAVSAVTLDGVGFAPLGTAIVKINAASDIDIGQLGLNINTNCDMKIFQSDEAILSDIDCNLTCEMARGRGQQVKTFTAMCSSKIDEFTNLYHFSLKDASAPETEDVCRADVKFDRKNGKLFASYAHGIDINMFKEILGELQLPRFETDLKLNGEFELEEWQGLLKGSGRLAMANIFVKQLPSLRSDLMFSGDFTLKMVNGVLSISSFNGICDSVGDSLRILCHSTNPLTIWSKAYGFSEEASILNFGQSIAKVVIDRFNPKIMFAGGSSIVVDTKVSGQFDVLSKGGEFFIKPSENCPLKFDKCTISERKKKYCDGVDLSCQLDLTLGKGIAVNLDEVSIGVGEDDDIVVGSVSLASAADSNNYEISCDILGNAEKLNKLSPLFRDIPPVKSGSCSLHADFTRKNLEINANAEIKLKSIAVGDRMTPVSGQIALTAAHTPELSKVNAEVNLSGKHSTAARMAFEAATPPSNLTTDVKFELRGDAISLPDIATIIAVPLKIFEGRSGFADDSTDITGDMDIKIIKKPTTSEWSRFAGRGIANVSKIFLSDSFAIDKFEFCCLIDPSEIDLKTITFYVAESPFSTDAKLEFLDNGAKNSYAFSMQAAFDMRDIGKICKMLMPDKQAVMEGSGKITAKFALEGDSAIETVRAAPGTVDIECSNGVIQPTKWLNEKNNAIVDVIGHAGAFLARRDMDSGFGATAALIDSLRSIEYDSIKIALKRRSDLNIAITEGLLVGPEILVDATGKISYVKYKNFLSYPLTLNVKIDAAGNLGDCLSRLGLTHGINDTTYMSGPRFCVKGTVGNPDYSDLPKVLYQIFRLGVPAN